MRKKIFPSQPCVCVCTRVGMAVCVCVRVYTGGDGHVCVHGWGWPDVVCRRKLCILTGVGSETMALWPSPLRARLCFWTTAWKSTSSRYKMGRYARKRGSVCGRKLRIVDSFVQTDVFSKRCRSYLLPNSCHAPSVFKGLISGVGARLRMLCSDDHTLEERLNNCSKYFCMSSWKRTTAQKEFRNGSSKNERLIL